MAYSSLLSPRRWTIQETLAALHLYLLLPFGQLHKAQPMIMQLAGWMDRSPSSLALKLVNLASLDPQILACGRVGMKNASAQDEQLWRDLQINWDEVALRAATEYTAFASQHGMPANSELTSELATYEGTTRATTLEVRVNQARFRKAILASYNETCCISGLRDARLVVASHIVPWSEDRQNRLNPRNGLCLSALHDRAYDQGLITVLPDFRVKVSSELAKNLKNEFAFRSLIQFDGRPISMPERLPPYPGFLAAHARRFGFL